MLIAVALTAAKLELCEWAVAPVPRLLSPVGLLGQPSVTLLVCRLNRRVVCARGAGLVQCVSTAAWHAKHGVCIAVLQPVESLHAAHNTDAVGRACKAAPGCRAIGFYAINPWPVMRQHMLSTSSLSVGVMHNTSFRLVVSFLSLPAAVLRV
jgi:hypothetical protein